MSRRDHTQAALIVSSAVLDAAEISERLGLEAQPAGRANDEPRWLFPARSHVTWEDPERALDTLLRRLPADRHRWDQLASVAALTTCVFVDTGGYRVSTEWSPVVLNSLARRHAAFRVDIAFLTPRWSRASMRAAWRRFATVMANILPGTWGPKTGPRSPRVTVSAGFAAYSTELDTSEISELLGVTPGLRMSRTPRPERPYWVWHGAVRDGEPAEKAVSTLLETLPAAQETWDSLAKLARLELYVYVQSDHMNPVVQLSSDILQALGHRHVALSMTVEFFDDDETPLDALWFKAVDLMHDAHRLWYQLTRWYPRGRDWPPLARKPGRRPLIR